LSRVKGRQRLRPGVVLPAIVRYSDVEAGAGPRAPAKDPALIQKGLAMTKVRVSLGYTVNMKNYESLRVDVAVEDEVRDAESVDEGYSRVRGFVETKLMETVEEVKADLKNLEQ
jgi:hypothetical protein